MENQFKTYLCPECNTNQSMLKKLINYNNADISKLGFMCENCWNKFFKRMNDMMYM